MAADGALSIEKWSRESFPQRQNEGKFPSEQRKFSSKQLVYLRKNFSEFEENFLCCLANQISPFLNDKCFLSNIECFILK